MASVNPFRLDPLTRFRDPRDVNELLRRPEDFGATPGIVPQGSVPPQGPGALPPALQTVVAGGSRGAQPPSGQVSPATPTTLSPVDLILSKAGRVGEFLQPVADFGGQLGDSFADSARSGRLAGLAPEFTAGVQSADRNDLQRQLIEAQIGLTNTREAVLAGGGGKESGDERFGRLNTSDFTPESLQAFRESNNFSDLVVRQDGNADPSAVREFEFFKRLTPEQQQEFLTVKRGFSVDDVTGLGQVDNSGNILVDEEGTRQAGAERVAAETQAREDVGQVPVLEGDLDNLNKFINDLGRTRDDIATGRLQTGFVAGRFPAITSSQQRFDELAGSQVLEKLKDGSFGQLNTRELQFVEDISLKRTKNEDVNIEEIDELLAIASRAKERSEGQITRIQGAPSSDIIDFSSLPAN